MIARLLGGVCFLLASFLIGGVRCYQLLLRPLLPPLCRFQPSCSEYFILAVRKYGPLRGACKGVGRLCRCNPWGGSGHDPP
jgi:putative membrane protein insertion efficiency factor